MDNKYTSKRLKKWINAAIWAYEIEYNEVT